MNCADFSFDDLATIGETFTNPILNFDETQNTRGARRSLEEEFLDERSVSSSFEDEKKTEFGEEKEGKVSRKRVLFDDAVYLHFYRRRPRATHFDY